ncbi:hypothetical protein L9F63_017181, partial [Diploptera punctata]
KGGAHPCIVCKTQLDQFLQSRPLPRSHAPQYGLREDEVTPGARVCNTCRCKSVRSRYTQCPLRTCPNTKGRVKRLRPLPGKWTELPAEIKDPIISEFQIPAQVSKCCSACFNRISRRLAPHLQDSGSAQGEDGDHSNTQQLRWTEEETEAAKRAIREHGTNWAKVAEKVGSNKTQHQCKNFYFNYRKKLGLDNLVQEYNKNHLGEERKPTVTDEEESGSSTSSCDEMTPGGIPRDNSDTDSAASPGTREQTEEKVNAGGIVIDEKHGERDLTNNGSTNSNGPGSVGNLRTLESSDGRTQAQQGQTSQSNASVKEDYDSSATETADEAGAEGDSRQSPKNISGNISYPPPSASNNTVTVTQSQPSHQGEVNGPSSPINVRSVKELMLGVIEMQIKKNPCGQLSSGVNVVTSEGAPTISSILKTDHRTDMMRPSSDITFVREYRPDSKQQQQQQALRVQLPQETSIAALSVVNSHHHSSSASGGSSLQQTHGGSGAAIIQHVPQMQATITPCSTTANDMPREGLVVVQVQQVQRETRGERNERNETSEPEGITLDLSIKKPRECSPSPMASVVRDSSPMGPRGDSPLFPLVPPHRDSPSLTPHTSIHTIPPPPAHKSMSSHHPPPHSVTVYRTDGGYYPHQVVVSTEQLRSVTNSPSLFVSAVLPHSERGSGPPVCAAPTSHLVMNQQPPSSRSGPQSTNTKLTKVPSLPPKLSPKLPPVGTKTGSITHGTPVSSSASLMVGGPSLHQLQQQQPRYEGLLRQMTPPQQQGKEGSTLTGSITQGTPVHHTPHHLTPDKRTDRSGLPIVAQGYEFYNKRLSPAAVAQNAANNSSGPAVGSGQSGYSPYPRDATAPQTTSAGGFTSPYPHQSTRPSASYVIEQQRHIIMSDYITSQKMPAPRRGSSGSNPPPSEKSQQDSPSPRGISSSPHYYPPGSAPAVYLAADARLSRSSTGNTGGMEQSQTPPHHTPPPPVRQGVIHTTPRHNAVPNRPPSSGNGTNPKPPSPSTSPHQRIHHLTPHHPQHHPHYPPPPGHPPPGHEAFSSLVDVAVQQPSLPVPHKDSDKRQQPHLLTPHHPHHHEGLGKTMADSINSARILADHQMQERERFATREQREREVHHSAEQRFTARDSHSEQQRFPSHHPEHYSQSSRERDQERFAARERESHQIQQQRELQQQQQQQLHLQQQIQQQQQSRLTTEFDQRQQRHRHQQPQMSYHGAAYRDHRVPEIETTRMMMGNFQRDGPPSGQPPSSARLHAGSQQSQQSQHSSEGSREREGVNRGAGGVRTPSSGSGETMTAASLIHAIITHQINQSSTDSLNTGSQSGSSNSSAPRPGDRLFQSFHREQQPPTSQQQQQQGSSQPPSSLHVPESNGKVSPMKSSHSPSVVHLDHEGPPSSQPSDSASKPFTLNEHIDSIISKDFSGSNAPPSSGGYGQQPHHRGMYASTPHHPFHMAPPVSTSEMLAHEHNSWKLRRALQQKEMEREREKSAASSRSSTPSMQADERQIIRIAQPASPRGNTPAGSKTAQYHVEPVSPPESSGGRKPGSAGKSLSPFDYVKNKIVEVMRTEDEKSDQDEGRGRCDSPGDMVIDESSVAVSQQNSGTVEGSGPNATTVPSSVAPAFVPTYPFSALGVLSAARSPTPSQPSNQSQSTSL